MQTAPLLKGTPSALYVLDYGLFKVHANGRVIGICGFLIQTDAGENVLIDTGFPEKYATDPERASQEDRLFEFGEVLRCDPSHMPAAQLAILGLNPGDITLNILSHSHIDHVGHLAAFPQAPILLSQAERALNQPLYWGNVQPIEWPDRDYVVIDTDTVIGQGFEVFITPGHSPGQLSFLISLPETGTVLLTSDAISRPAEIDERFEGSWDPDKAIASAARLMARAEAEEALVIYGHCPAQWQTLTKAPEGYF